MVKIDFEKANFDNFKNLALSHFSKYTLETV